jgi:hypothetical protein
MLETGCTIGFETNSFFNSGYWLPWPSILCRIGGFVGFGGPLATALPGALGSIGFPITSCMIFVSATFALLKCAVLIFGRITICQSRHCSRSNVDCCDKPCDFAMSQIRVRRPTSAILGRFRANRKNGSSCDPELVKHPPPGVDSEQRTPISSNWQCRAAPHPDGKHCQPPSNHR